MLQHLNRMIQRHGQALQQVIRGGFGFGTVAVAVKATRAPARQVRHGVAQGSGRDGAGMDRHAAQAATTADHQHRVAQFGTLDRRPASPDPITGKSTCAIVQP